VRSATSAGRSAQHSFRSATGASSTGSGFSGRGCWLQFRHGSRLTAPRGALRWWSPARKPESTRALRICGAPSAMSAAAGSAAGSAERARRAGTLALVPWASPWSSPRLMASVRLGPAPAAGRDGRGRSAAHWSLQAGAHALERPDATRPTPGMAAAASEPLRTAPVAAAARWDHAPGCATSGPAPPARADPGATTGRGRPDPAPGPAGRANGAARRWWHQSPAADWAAARRGWAPGPAAIQKPTDRPG